MNNYSSSSFSTVFFLVAVFIGMGILIYHSVDITKENGQLRETVETMQTSVETLSTANVALKTENASLKTANSTYTTDNHTLKADLEKAAAEMISLKALVANNTTELEKLRHENSILTTEKLRLNKLQSADSRSPTDNHEVLQSTLIPTDLELWMKVATVIIVMGILFIGYTLHIFFKDRSQKRVAFQKAIYVNRGFKLSLK